MEVLHNSHFPIKKKSENNIILLKQDHEHKYNTIYSDKTALPNICEVAESYALFCSKCESTIVCAAPNNRYIRELCVNKEMQVLHSLHVESWHRKYKLVTLYGHLSAVFSPKIRRVQEAFNLQCVFFFRRFSPLLYHH